MSLGLENLLENIYAPNDVPYWGENIPVLVVREIIAEAEKEARNKCYDLLSQVIDGYSKLGMQEEAMAVNRAYDLLIKGEN
jgi:hypothetical protein